MKNITLKKNEPLGKLVFLTGKNKPELIEHILNAAIQEEVIFDEPEYCGSSLAAYFSDAGFTLSAAVLYALCNSTREIEEAFSGLIVWGIPDECPLCGSKTEKEEELSEPDWDDGSQEVIGEFVICTNPECNYTFRDDNEPDPDFYRD